MKGLTGLGSRRVDRRGKIAHIRLSEGEFLAVVTAARRAGLSVSAFLRSLSLEGAGVQPFLSRADRAVLELLGHDMRAVVHTLNQFQRALNAGRTVDASAAAVADARAVAMTVAAELAAMAMRAGAARRGEVR
jgi:hypothetical protein